MKRFVAVGVAALCLQYAQAKEDVVRVLQAVNDDSDSELQATTSSPTDSPTVHPLKGTPLPKRCEDEINEGRQYSKFCTKWLEVNEDFIMPTQYPSESPSAAPTPFYNVQSSTFIADNDRLSLNVDISTVDDTFIELFRPDTPLGDKTNLKIDALEGAPTKVTMLKFNIGETINQVILNNNVDVTLISAKLHLYAKNTATFNQFGGYVEEIDSDWLEETSVWRDYVKGGPAEKKNAENLLPSVNDTLATFEAVSPWEWAEADITERLHEIVEDWKDTAVPQFAVRITTDISEGVVFSSKEDVDFGPKLSLVFEYEGTALEVAAAVAVANNGNEAAVTSNPTPRATSNPTDSPSAVSSSLPTPSPSSTPTLSPMLSTSAPVVQTLSPVISTTAPTIQTSPVISTTAPVAQTESPVAATTTPSTHPSTSSPTVSTTATPSGAPSLLPTPSPSRSPSPPPTPSPTAAVTDELTEASAAIETTATSVVTQMFRLRIAATTEAVRRRNLQGSRELSPFTSLEVKERPALEEHLMNVYSKTLTSSPERVDITFVNDEMNVEIVGSSTVVRSNEFKISAIFLDPRIASIPANEASAVLDRATLHAFTGTENTAFVSILENTGDRFISDSERIKVDVSKMSFSIGDVSGQSIQAATATEGSAESWNEKFNEAAGGWAGPALAIGASLVVVASALASFILIRQRRHHYSYDEEHKNTSKPLSPTNTEAVTPSPEKKEGGCCVDFPSTNLNYDFSPIAPQKLVAERPADLDCPPHISLSHLQCRSFDDSTVSNVSAYIYAGMMRSPERYKPMTDGDKSGIESEQFLFDNVLGNDHDLPTDGSAPNFLVDDDSAFAGDVPSELYSKMSMDDSMSIQSHDLPSGYGVKAFMLEDMLKAKHSSHMDMPPPPSDAGSEASSQQDFPSDPFADNSESKSEDSCQKAINDELKKVMMILNEPAAQDGKVESRSDDSTEDDPISNIYDVPYLQSADRKGTDHPDGSVQSSVLSDDDPVKLMNSALDDCMAILQKARPNDIV